MALFRFHAKFIPAILAGKKNSTIRRTKCCEIGNHVLIVTKEGHSFETSTCIGIAPITIKEEGWKQPMTGKKGKLYPKCQPLHEQEGFQNLNDFIAFFKKQYGLPFDGYLHVWKPLK